MCQDWPYTSAWEDRTYTIVNKGETSEPSRADRAAELWVPPSAGAIESVQMPHQQRILRECDPISNPSSTAPEMTCQPTHSPKYGGWRDHAHKPTCAYSEGTVSIYAVRGLDIEKTLTSMGCSLGGRVDLYRNFCRSATDSISQPMTQMMTPRMSLAWPKLGACPSVTLGEFKIIMGRETVQTHSI